MSKKQNSPTPTETKDTPFPGKTDFAASPGDIYDKLQYGVAPESPMGVEGWLNEHKRQFGAFINNQWVKPKDRKFRRTYIPATKEVMCETMEATNAEVDMAMKAAREAFKSWSALSCHERAKHLYAIARHVQKHSRLLSVLEALDNGKPFRETKNYDIPIVVRHLYHHAGWAQLMDEQMKGYGPVGVCAEIVPWNFPLMLLSWKVCPALAMGNTIVLKPASYTRLTALAFAEICAEAGLPPGVFNVLTGPGSIGSAIADHPEADKVAFTGSTEIGRLLRQRIAGSGKKISLELGGKSPFVVFDTADMDSAVEGVVDAIWFNQGQVCCAGSRLLVQESIYEKFIHKLKNRMDKLRLGHSLEKDIDMGALVDQSQFDTITGFVERAKQEGCTIYHANIPIPNVGWYFPPTLITDCAPVSECVREEIFGPILAAMPFRDPKEAIDLANNTKFGLAASVWTEDISLALEMAISIKAGAVWVNCHNMFDAAAGFGGYRESGFGRDGGKEGLFEYVKPLWAKRPNPPLQFPSQIEQIRWPALTAGHTADVAAANAADRKSAGGGLTIDRTPKLYIGGKQARPDWEHSRPVLSADGKLICEVPEGNRKDLRNAVEAAHKAAPGWGKRAAHNRAQICYYIAENLQCRFEEFARRIHVQTGRPMDSCEKEVELSIQRLFYYAAYADKFGGSVQETTLYGVTTSINEPVGVIGIACPDEYPLLGFVSLISPCLVRGNTVIVIPSERHPLCATDLYQVFDTSDLPGGVINIVTGNRDVLTKTLVEHQDLQAMWYFGNAEISRNVEWVAGDNMKRTWVSYGVPVDWESNEQGQGIEFLRRACEVKNIWIPMGELK